MQKIKKGDEVIVLAGKDKGKRGTVLSFQKDKNTLLVENINMVKKHTKPNPNKGVTGGIVEKEMPINMSNIALYDATSKKGSRVGFKVMEDGSKVRVFRSSGEVVDV